MYSQFQLDHMNENEYREFLIADGQVPKNYFDNPEDYEDEQDADLAAQEGKEVTLLSDQEIIKLLSDEVELDEDWN